MADKPKHRHTGHRERMKAEFLARGLEGWPDHRVLELLLFYTIPQGDVNDLAHELVERFGSLAGVLDASVEELKKVKGVGDHTAVFLRMLPAVLGRYQGAPHPAERHHQQPGGGLRLAGALLLRGPERDGLRPVPGRQAAGAGGAEGGRGQH